MRSDAINSMDLAQLASDARFDRVADVEFWYNYYLFILGILGWSILSSERCTTPTGSDEFSMAGDVVPSLAARCGAGASATLADSARELGSLSTSDERVALFQGGEAAPRVSSFRVQAVANSRGELKITLGACHYSTDEAISGNVLNHKFKSNRSSLTCKINQLQLYDKKFDCLRENVIRRLGDQADRLVGNLGLSGS
jgi:hypothetical protein